MRVKKLLSAGVCRIKKVSQERYLIVRRNRFDLIDPATVKRPIFSSANISNPSNVFVDTSIDQVIFTNTVGKAVVYKLSPGEKLSEISFQRELFGNLPICSNGENFFFLSKSGKVMRLEADGQHTSPVFPEETDITAIICQDEAFYLFQELERKVDSGLRKYAIKCYQQERLIKENSLLKNSWFSIHEGVLDFDQKTYVLRGYQESISPEWACDDTFCIFDTEELDLKPLFTTPHIKDLVVCYDYATMLEKNILAYASGEEILLFDIRSGEIIDRHPIQYSFAVRFISSNKLLVGTPEALYSVEFDL